MERNATGLVLGLALDKPLHAPELYSLEIFKKSDAEYLGKSVSLPVSLTDLELLETHIHSIAAKLSLPLKPTEFFVVSHGE